MGWFFSKPNGQIGLLGGKVSEFDFKRLFVLLAHVSDARLISVHPIAREAPQEGAKGLLYILDHLFLLDPLGKGFFCLSILVHIGHVPQAIVVVDFFSTTHHSCLGSPVIFLT